MMNKLNLPLLVLVIALGGCGLLMDNEERLDRAEAAIASGDFRTAIIDTKDVLRQEPDNVRARLLLAEASLEIGDGASAEKELLRAIELGEPRQDRLVDLGRSLVQQAKFEQVISEIAAEDAASEEDATRIRQLRAESFLGLNESARAREMFERVLDREPDNVEAKLGIVSSLVAEQNLAQARATLDQVMTEHPEVTEVWLTSGSLNLQLRSYQNAESNFRAALARSGELAEAPAAEVRALAGLADALVNQEKVEEARAVVDQLLAKAPDGLPTLLLDARIAMIDEDWPRAQQNLQRVLQLSPENRPAQFLLGAVQLRSGNLAQAEMYLSAVVANEPNNREARRLLAESRLQMQRLDSAQEALRPMVASDDADARSLSMAARASSGLGQYDEALRYLEQAIEVSPQDADLRFQLITTYLDAGRFGDAERMLNEMPADGTDGNMLQRDALLVLTRLREGNEASALENAGVLVERYPEDVRAYNVLGAVQRSAGNDEAARDAFETAISLEPGNVAARRYLAAMDEAEENLVAAAERYQAILEDYPQATWTMFALARVAYKSEDRQLAADWLEKLRSAESLAIRPRIILAQLYLEMGREELAETVLDEVIAADASLAEAHNLLGSARLRQDDYQGAINSYRRATDLDRGNSRYRINLAEAQRRQGDVSNAIQTLQNRPGSGTDDLSASVMLASMMVDDGDLPGAMEVARDLQRSYPDNATPYALEGEIHTRNGDFADAMKAYERAMAIDMLPIYTLRAFQARTKLGTESPEKPLIDHLGERPTDSQIRLVLATYYNAAGNLDRSIEEYEQLVALDPNNTIALNNLAWTYYTVGDDRAESLARQAHESDPDSAAAADTLGWILVQNGKAEAGVEILRKAVSKEGSRAQHRYHLAAGLVELGDRAEARRTLEEILAADEDFASRAEAEELLRSL